MEHSVQCLVKHGLPPFAHSEIKASIGDQPVVLYLDIVLDWQQDMCAAWRHSPVPSYKTFGFYLQDCRFFIYPKKQHTWLLAFKSLPLCSLQVQFWCLHSRVLINHCSSGMVSLSSALLALCFYTILHLLTSALRLVYECKGDHFISSVLDSHGWSGQLQVRTIMETCRLEARRHVIPVSME